MTESEPTLTWETERLIWLRFHTIECEKRRPGGIFDVRARRLSVQQSLRARFGIHTVDGAPRPWTRGPSPATAPAWWPECPERGHAVSATWATYDAGLVVPDQPPRHPAELLHQLPRAQQQVLGLPRRDHPSRHEPRICCRDHKTGSSFVVPSSSGIFLGGNHRSHCAASPAVQVIRSAGSTGDAQDAAAARCH